MTLFTVDIRVRFQHTDPAGIVFYPRYFEMVNQVVEDWFAGALGVDFRTLHDEHLCGIPTVRIESDFKRPSRMGEILTFSLGVEALGKSSFTLDLCASCQGEERLSAKAVLAYVKLGGLGPVPIPRELRLAMERYCVTGDKREVA